MKQLLISLTAFLVAMQTAFAAEGQRYLQGTIYDPVTYIVYTAYWVIFMTLVFILLPKSAEEHHKKVLFALFTIPIILSSFYLAGVTVYKNVLSETGGPIHWHADYQVWYCGEELDLINPTGILNKVGTPLFHEHNDNRMHVEGTPLELQDINLRVYFKVIGGALSETTGIVFPSENKGVVSWTPGQDCPGEPETVLNVYINGERTESFEEYVIYPHALVPPGDCIIYEVGGYQEETDRICPSWEVNGWTYDNFNQKRGEMN